MAHCTTHPDSLKKRYTFTLTPSHMIRLRALLKRNGQPVAMLSVIVDETIHGICETVEGMERSFKEGRQLSFGEIFHIVGESMDHVKL
jgi:hypothetical protein